MTDKYKRQFQIEVRKLWYCKYASRFINLFTDIEFDNNFKFWGYNKPTRFKKRDKHRQSVLKCAYIIHRIDYYHNEWINLDNPYMFYDEYCNINKSTRKKLKKFMNEVTEIYKYYINLEIEEKRSYEN